MLEDPALNLDAGANVDEGCMIGPPDPVMRFFLVQAHWIWDLDGRALMFAAILVSLIGAFVGLYFWDLAFDEE